MMQSRIPGYALLTLLIIGTPVFARVVISEVMWMGSDQSTADEWVEMVGVGDGLTSFPLSMSGWTLRVQSGTGESIIARFGDVSIASGQYLVVSNYPAAESRLSVNPALTTTAMLLPNTKLLLRLYDAHSTLIDEVDDGIGVPFAGASLSGTGAKASMERIDLREVGNVKENWQAALVTLGFDPGVPIFGTPGFPRPLSLSSSSFPSSSSPNSSSSASTSFSSFVSESSVLSSRSSISFSSFSLAPRSSSQASEVGSASSSCIPDVSNIHIAVQSGEPRGEGKVTVNLQLLWEGKGTLRCTWDYGEGFTSTSCNPPSHTFSLPGKYEVRVEAEDFCGGKTTRTFPIEVLAGGETGGGLGGAVWRASSSSMSVGSCMPQTFTGIEIARFLPNPNGEDSAGEWVEIRNMTDRVAVLCGWLLDDAEGGSVPFPLDVITLVPKEIRRFLASFTGLGLNNDQDHIRLFAPARVGNQILVQDVSYTNAREGIVMNALLPIQGTQGRVVRVIDGDTVVLGIDNREVTVRLLGIDAPELHDKEGGRWGMEAAEFLRGLLEGANVELSFDEERQDVYGRILSYLSVGGHDVQAELLKLGLATVYQRCTCVRKEGYLRLEEEGRKNKVGMWERGEGSVISSVPSVPPTPLGPPTDKRAAIFLSEVYPVPLPAEGEWVELWNGGEEPLDLSGWKLDDEENAGSRAWEFPEGFIIQPGAFIVLRSDQTHLAFNNDGDSVVLITPDGTVVDRITYGKLRRGRAFARVIQRLGNTGEFRKTDRFCITDRPTPFERNICEEELSPFDTASPAVSSRVSRAKSRDVSREQAGLVTPVRGPEPLRAEWQGDTSNISVPSKARRVVRLARRVRYHNILPPGVLSGSVVTSDPMFAPLLAHMERSESGGQVVWGREVPPRRAETTEWEAIFLPFLLVVGAHGMLVGMRRSS